MPSLATGARLHVGFFTGDWGYIHPMRRLCNAFLLTYPKHLLHVTLFYNANDDEQKELEPLLERVDAHQQLKGALSLSPVCMSFFFLFFPLSLSFFFFSSSSSSSSPQRNATMRAFFRLHCKLTHTPCKSSSPSHRLAGLSAATAVETIRRHQIQVRRALQCCVEFFGVEMCCSSAFCFLCSV